ncbi:glycosyltransferase [Marinomonas sp. A3A]|nr:glycosyltransferase [Marinomonas sp. A3A]
MEELLKAFNKPEDKFETVLFLPEGESRQGQGGLRTQGYFKQSKEGKPLITVVTVVYNGESLLEETILSVINQTYDNVEYIIIDGGSSDGTLDIIRKYQHAIDYWVSEKDSGIYDAMNKGIDLATGDWINFMNSGDCFYSSTILSEIFSNLSSQDEIVIYGNRQVIYPSGRARLVKAGLINNLWKGSQFCHQASFTKVQYHKMNIFDINIKIVADFDFFYRAWKNDEKFKYVDIVLANIESGGISDLNRIDSILGCWTLVDKTFKNNFFYCFLIIKESLKDKVKRFVKA